MPFQSAEPVGQRVAAAVARFGTDVTERFSGAVTGEPEDQLRGPFENLFRVLADEAGIPAAVLTGELLVAAVSSKPDYGVTVGGLLCGYVELKAPGTGAVTARFTGRNLAQWQRIRELPNLLYTDGNEWALYRDGQIVGQPVRLDGDVSTSGRRLAADPRLVDLVGLFLKWTVVAPANARALANSTARLCRLLRGQVLESLEAEAQPGWDGARPLTGLMRDWRALLYPEADDQEFADSYAQTVTFALLLARAEGIDLAGATPSAIAGQLSAHEHALLGRALQVLTDEAVARQVDVALSTLVRVIGAVDWSGLGDGPEPWRYFYEDFLSVYDSSLRERAGAYYTPAPVVAAQVRLGHNLLQSRLGLTDGLADDTVTVLDPAMGTASYLIETVNLVADEAGRYGEGYVGQAVDALAPRLMGFELMAGSYAVGETLIAAALRRRGGTGRGARLYLTDTLSDPDVEHTQLGGMYTPIADSRRGADMVKREERVVVCLGNPPYDLHASGDTTAGGWVTHPSEGTALWQDFVGSVIGTPAARSLKPVYKLYAYFWRWALWKVFEAHPDQEQAAGVVSFITASSFVSGPGWAGVREHMRRVCDEIWVIDLSREGHQPPVPTRIFPKVQQPVAITMCVRYRDHDPSRPAAVRYLPVTGKRAEKFTRLAGLSLDDPAWEVGADDWTGPLVGAVGGAWPAMPGLADLLPWGSSGVSGNRSWPYAPSREVLSMRWGRLAAASGEERKELFKETRDRTLGKTVPALPGAAQPVPPTLAGPAIGPAPVTVRIGFRSFDRQWVLADPRLLDFPRRPLWRSHGARQVYLTTHVTAAPLTGTAATATAYVPELNHYAGRGGLAIPLWRDAEGTEANVAPGLPSLLAERLGTAVAGEDVFLYVAALMAHPGYSTRFAEELGQPGPRIPLIRNSMVSGQAKLPA